MTTKLKVYGGNLDGKHRSIVAARSQKEAARLFRCSMGSIRNYCSVTGVKEEIAVAMERPGVVWRKPFTWKFSEPSDGWEEVKS